MGAKRRRAGKKGGTIVGKSRKAPQSRVPDQRRTKGNCTRQACLTMVFKLMQSAQKRWRLLNGSNLLPDVIQGTQFIDGLNTQEAAA